MSIFRGQSALYANADEVRDGDGKLIKCKSDFDENDIRPDLANTFDGFTMDDIREQLAEQPGGGDESSYFDVIVAFDTLKRRRDRKL